MYLGLQTFNDIMKVKFLFPSTSLNKKTDKGRKKYRQIFHKQKEILRCNKRLPPPQNYFLQKYSP